MELLILLLLVWFMFFRMSAEDKAKQNRTRHYRKVSELQREAERKRKLREAPAHIRESQQWLYPQ